MPTTTSDPAGNNGDERTEQALARIADALVGLRYGEVVVKVQDGVVVLVERTERVRVEGGTNRGG